MRQPFSLWLAVHVAPMTSGFSQWLFGACRPALPAVTALMFACGTPATPSESANLVVAGGESGRLVYLDSQGVGAVGNSPFTFGPILASAFDGVRKTAFLTALSGSGRELIAIDLGAGMIKWRVPMADVSHAVYYDGIQLPGEPISFLADGRTVLIGNALRGDTIGIATFEPETKTIGGFRGPLKAMGFQVLGTSGAIAAYAQIGRRSDGKVSVSVILLGPDGLQTLDSIAAAPPHQDPIQMVESPDGDRIYMGNYTHLFSYSLGQRRVTASVSRPAFGDLAISPDGRVIVLSDEGSFPDDPGSGRLFVFDEVLGLQKAIDLSAASLTGAPVVTHGVAFSRDGKWLYAAAGTRSVGPLYDAQRSQLIVIDARTLELVKAIQLNDWGPVLLFPLH